MVSLPCQSVSRVLMIAPTPFFGDRGCHVRIYEEVRALEALGIESLVVTYPAGKDVAGVSIRRAMALPGVQPSALGPSWGRPLLDATLLASVLGAISDFRPDILHAHLHEGIVIGTIAGRIRGVPVVADLQGSLVEELIDHRALSPDSATTRSVRSFERWLVKRPDVLLVSSVAASELVASAHVPRERVVPLPDGADLDVFKPVGKDPALLGELGLAGRPVVAFLGVLTPYQGVDLLLDAIPLVKRAVSDVHFLVMGYPNEAHYRTVVRDRGLADTVTLPGRIVYADAPRWLCLADVAVSAKRSLTEANGKLLNYMACGLPTVATDTPVNRELLGDLGRFTPPGDATALANAIVALLHSPQDRAQLGAALRARVEQQFSWQALAQQLAGVYARVATGATGAA